MHRFCCAVRRAVVSGAAVALLAPIAAAGVIHVDDDAPGDPGPGDPLVSDPAEDGSPAHPYDAIQEAIAAAANGDEVLVADGLYRGPGNHDIDLLGRAIVVRSASGDPASCTVDASLGAPPVRGFIITSGEGTATIIQGFTITGAAATDGGGILCLGSRPTIRGCAIVGNVADRGGGAFVSGAAAQPAFINCRFESNDAIEGAGVAFEGAGGVLANCLLLSNLAQGAGGAIMNRDSSPRVVNCTIVANVAAPPGAAAGLPGGGMFTMGPASAPLVVNSIVRENAPGQVIDNADGAATSVRYSNIEGGWSGLGEKNIDIDPMFVNPLGGDWGLQTGSPCADAGLNWGVPIDTGDLDGDGNLAELLPRDLAGQPRFNADEQDYDPGCGVPVVVDMGAVEYQGGPVEDVIFGDLDGDGLVTVVDLLALLAAWGPGEDNCLGDLNATGATDIADLLALLSAWSG